MSVFVDGVFYETELRLMLMQITSFYARKV